MVGCGRREKKILRLDTLVTWSLMGDVNRADFFWSEVKPLVPFVDCKTIWLEKAYGVAHSLPKEQKQDRSMVIILFVCIPYLKVCKTPAGYLRRHCWRKSVNPDDAGGWRDGNHDWRWSSHYAFLYVVLCLYRKCLPANNNSRFLIKRWVSYIKGLWR